MAVQGAPVKANRLKANSLGTLGVVILVLSAASPLIGLTGAIPTAMVLGNGIGAPMAFVLVGIILLIFASGYIAMSRQVTNAGALYAFVGKGLGLPVGLGAAGLAWWAYTTVQLAVYGFFGVVASGTLLQYTSIDLPWWVCTLILMALIQVFGYLGVEIGAKVLLVLMALEWATMLLLSLAILFTGGAGEGFAAGEVWSLGNLTAAGISVALIFAFASMFGFESSAIYGEETRNPKKTIGRATVISICMITLFFAFTGWMLIVGYGPGNAVNAALATLEGGDPAQYVFASGEQYLGSWAPLLMSLFVITSMFACNLAFHNGIARYQYTLGRDGILPKGLARTRANGSPYISSFVQTITVLIFILIAVITGADPIAVVFFWFSGIAVVALVSLYVLTAIAVLVFFAKNKQAEANVWSRLISPVLSIILLGYSLYLIVSNFELLVGTSKEQALLLAATAIVAFIVGLVLFLARRNHMSSSALADLEQEVS
jgi:amino acid transporter